MITLSVDYYNPVSQDFYDKIINSLPFYRLTCTCGHSACLTIHGYYCRSMKFEDSKVSLRICRVKCSICGHTHALLLSNMVPYSQIPLFCQVDILSRHISDKDFSTLMDSMPSLDEGCIRYVIGQWKRHWEQRLLSEGILPEHGSLLVRRCFLAFCRQFMQIKSTPNILFLTPT